MDDGLRRKLESEFGPADSSGPNRARAVRVELDDLTRLVRRVLDAAAAPGSQVSFEAEARLAAGLEAYQRIELLRQRLEEHRADVQDELARLRAALVARRGFVEDQIRPSAWPVDPERWHTLRLRVQARLAEFAEQKGADAPPSRLIATELLDLFAKERAASLAEMRRRSDFEISQLERRLAGLDVTLEEASELLCSVRELPQVEFGVASHFRQVAGLDAEARSRELKSAILSGIFRANCDLQERDGPPSRSTH